jgi:phosphoribosylformylglycinamidine synthase
VTIGRVTADGLMRVKVGSEVAAEIPAAKLADDAPIYHREVKQPDWEIANRQFAITDIREPRSCQAILPKLLASPTIASKNWVYRQYDHMVQDGTVVAPGSDAAVMRVNLRRPDLGYTPKKGEPVEKYFAFSTDCNSTYCFLDPREGGKTAVAEAARNLVCSGARPLAVTNCLNFGNPMKPEIFWQFRHCIEGMAEACRTFATPVTGGNVSFYNESPAAAVDPTPTIGMLGLIDDAKHITTQWFKEPGHVILLLGDLGAELGGSEYLKRIHGRKAGAPPRMDLPAAKKLHDLMLAIIRQGWVKSAHDCSEGGLAVALAECCMSNGEKLVGAKVNLSKVTGRVDAALFGESQNRIVISAGKTHAARIIKAAGKAGVPVTKLGVTGGRTLQIKTAKGNLSWDVPKLRTTWWTAIGRLMDR